MGGWVTAPTAANHPDLLGVVLVSAPDPGLVGTTQGDSLAALMADNMESLSGVSAQSMGEELVGGASGWRFETAAPGLARMPMLVLTSDDGLAAHSDPLVRRGRMLGNTRLTMMHRLTDHSWSDKRIALQTAVLDWLTRRQGR